MTSALRLAAILDGPKTGTFTEVLRTLSIRIEINFWNIEIETVDVRREVSSIW